jgi:hypothetical protein
MKTRETRTSPQQVFDSMASAAAALGISVTLLRRAKASGAPGFRGSRVHVDEVRKWLAAHKDAVGKVTGRELLQLSKLSEEVRKLKMQNDEKASVLVNKASLISALQIGAGQWDHERLRIEAEEPAKLAGITSVAEMATEVKRLMDAVCRVLNGLGKAFANL